MPVWVKASRFLALAGTASRGCFFLRLVGAIQPALHTKTTTWPFFVTLIMGQLDIIAK